MAKWENLKNAVAAVVKTNGNKEITGANMQAVLNSIINAVGGNAGFAGIATPTTQSGIPDGPTFYIATQGGTYSYFPTDGQGTPATIQDGVISVLYNQGNGLWSVTTTPMSIADGSVTNAKLANGAVSTGKIANGAVDTAKIAEHTIRWENMDQGAVDKDILQDDAVIESKIKDGAVTEYKLGTNSVSQRSIINGAVTEAKLANNSVTGSKIAIGTITSAKIADGTITGNEIAPNSIESSNLNYGAVDNEILADGAVTTDKLAPFAVDTGNIENGAVTKGKLDEDVVAILDDVDNKANTDGFYDTMGVGTARNLLGKTSIVDTFFRKIIGIGVAKGNGYVDGVRGNSEEWNQILPVNWVQSGSVGNVTYTINSDGFITLNGEVGESNRNFGANIPLIVNGHTYYYSAGSNNADIRVSNALQDSEWGNAYIINNISNKEFYIVLKAGASFSNYKIYPQIHDLTLMFGAGNEPATPEAFEAWLAANVGKADYYAYDAGSLQSVKMQNVKTVGFNQWDEQWDMSASNFLIPKNYITVLPTTQYFFHVGSDIGMSNLRVVYYDSEKNNIGDSGWRNREYQFTTPPNCAFIKFQIYASVYGNTYKNDICINFSNSALNGTYMPYQTQTKALPVTTLTGNHLGTRSTIFPNGMRGVGNGYDEISGNSAIVRIASVKVSDLEWVDVEGNVFVTNIPTRKYGNGIIVLCDKYASQARGVDKGIYAHTITDSVLVMDTAYQSVAEFKAAMGDATILFELAEPIEYTDLMDEQDNDFSLPIGIEVEPLGTLETLPQNTEGEALTMCAPTLSMQFSIDAAKILTDELPNEYRTNADDKTNWQKFLAIMNEKLGGAMGGTISVDDAAVGHGLDFTFAAAQAENKRDVEPIEE